MRRARAAFTFGSMLGAFCTLGELDAQGVARVDSAGFTIVTNTRDASSLSPILTAPREPRLRIGVEEGPEHLMFSQIRSVARMDDGRILVANGQPMEIRVFSPTGAFLAKFGRRGQGPGEFQSVTRAMSGGGDTVLAVNMPQFQLVRFMADGRHLGTVTVHRDSLARRLPGQRLSEGTREFMRNGSTIVTTRPATAGPTDGEYVAGELHRTQSTTYWISRDHSRSAALGSFGGIQQMFIALSGGRRTFEIPPAARRTLSAVGAGGTRFCAAGNETPEVRCVDQDGRRLIVRWKQESVRTAPADIERWREGVRAGATRPGSSPEIAERILAGMRIPPTVPPVRGFRIDAQGRLYISGPDLVSPEGLLRYRVFSRDGELLGVADLPPVGNGELGDDFIIGLTRNAEGVESVVLHDVKRGG